MTVQGVEAIGSVVIISVIVVIYTKFAEVGKLILVKNWLQYMMHLESSGTAALNVTNSVFLLDIVATPISLAPYHVSSCFVLMHTTVLIIM